MNREYFKEFTNQEIIERINKNEHPFTGKPLPNYTDGLDAYIGQKISGKKLKEIIGPMPLLKCTFERPKNEHYDKYNPTNYSQSDGFDIITLANFRYKLEFCKYATKVKVFDDAEFYVENHQLICEAPRGNIWFDASESIKIYHLLALLINEYEIIERLQRLTAIEEKDENRREEIMKEITKEIQKNGSNIKYVHPQYRTKKILFESVKNSCVAMFIIEEKETTPELLIEAIKGGYHIYRVKAEDRTIEMLFEAVKHKQITLKDIEEKDQTDEIISLALQMDGLSIKYAKLRNKTHEDILKFYLIAVQQNGMALRKAPDNVMTDEIMFAAVKQNGLAIMHVRSRYRTNMLILEAIKQNSNAMQYIKLTKQMKQFLKQNGVILY